MRTSQWHKGISRDHLVTASHQHPTLEPRPCTAPSITPDLSPLSVPGQCRCPGLADAVKAVRGAVTCRTLSTDDYNLRRRVVHGRRPGQHTIHPPRRAVLRAVPSSAPCRPHTTHAVCRAAADSTPNAMPSCLWRRASPVCTDIHQTGVEYTLKYFSYRFRSPHSPDRGQHTRYTYYIP